VIPHAAGGNEKERCRERLPWITPADLSKYTEKTISYGARNISKEGLENSGARLLPAGAVLFSTRAPIGYVAIASIPVTTNQGFKSFVLKDEVIAGYAFYYLQRARQLAIQMASGTTFLELSGKKAAQIPIPVPPLPEQRRIVAEIEKQFTRLEAGVSALKRVQANLKRYRAAVLKAACEGRLVPTEAELQKSGSGVSPLKQSRDGSATFETGEQLLKRILAERRKNWIVAAASRRRSSDKQSRDGSATGQYKEPATPDTKNRPPLPDGWTWASLDQLLQNVTDGDHLPPPQTISGIPLLVIGNIRTGKLSFKDTRFVARDYYDAIDAYRKPQRGDILYSLVGSYGIGLLVDTDQEFCIQRHIGILRPHCLSPSGYLAHMLNSCFAFMQATAAATGTAQKTVSLAGLRQFAIPLPPLAEQTRIVAEVERRLSVVEELEATVSANLQRATRLRQSILQKAFTGELA
jgi:type I restriction enzyme, S subunit